MGQHTLSQRVPHPLQCAHKHTHIRAHERARAHTYSSAASPPHPAARPQARRWHRAGGGAHLGSALGRGRRSVVNASGRTWFRGGGGGPVRAQRSPAGAIAEWPPAAPAAPWWRRRPPGPGRCGGPSWYPRSSLWTSTISRGPRQRPAWRGCCGPRSGAQVPAGGRQVRGAGLGGRDRGNNSVGRRGPWTSRLATRPGRWTLVAQLQERGGGGAGGPAPCRDSDIGAPGEPDGVCGPPEVSSVGLVLHAFLLFTRSYTRKDPRTHTLRRPCLRCRRRGELREYALSPPPP